MMSQKMKRILAISCLSSFAITSAPMMALAETTVPMTTVVEDEAIAPRLKYIMNAHAVLKISDGVATVDCLVDGDFYNATKTKVIAELQLKSGSGWLPVGLWTDTQNDSTAWVYETKSVTEGEVYRVKATVTVWEGEQSETKTIFTEERTA